MAEAEQQAPEQPKTVNQKQVIASKVTGTVKWFNVKSGYGFINRNDTKEDVFVHQSAIIKNNPKKVVRSVGDGEIVEFSVVVGEKGNEAANVTGPNGEPVKGSPYAADRRRSYRQWYPRGGARVGGPGGPRGGPRRPLRDTSEGGGEGVEGGQGLGGGEGGVPPQRRFRPRRGRGGYGYYRGPYRGGPQDDQGGDGIEGGPRGGVGPGGRGPPRRFFRRNFRGGRGGGGGPRRARSQDSQGGQGGMASGGEEGGQGQLQQRGGPQRPRYRRRGPVRPRSTSGGGNGNGGGPQEQQQGQQSPPPQQQQLQQQQQQSEPAWDIVAKAEESTGTIKSEESQPVQNTTTESTA